MPRRWAVSGWISTHELHEILLTGSGSSSNHGLFAPRPSPSVGDGYVTRKKSPWVDAIDVDLGAEAGLAASVRAAKEPAAMPLGSAFATPCAPPGKPAINQVR